MPDLNRTAAGLILSILSTTCPVLAETQCPQAGASPALAQSANAYAFRVGVLEAWSLKDSDQTLPVGGGQTPWSDPAVPGVLLAAGLPADVIALSNQPLLIRDGQRLVLIDTGVGENGRLQASLVSAGFQPSQVTDILISDYYDDHLGGLLTPEGVLAFPNATMHMPAADWEAMLAYPGDAAVVAGITPKVSPFAPAEVLAPGIIALPLPGHTESHTGFMISSGNDRLLYFGDSMHSAILSLAHPEWNNGDDIDKAAGVATRQGLLSRAVSQDLRLYGPHFPWPGLGRVQQRDGAYVWCPEP